MAEPRLHIRPRLGDAMTLTADGILPMAARALDRRDQNSRVAGTAAAGLNAAAPLSEHEGAAPQRGADDPATAVTQAAQHDNAESSTTADYAEHRPGLRLVARQEAVAPAGPDVSRTDASAAGAEVPRRDGFDTTRTDGVYRPERPVEPTTALRGGDAISFAASMTLHRWQQAGTAALMAQGATRENAAAPARPEQDGETGAEPRAATTGLAAIAELRDRLQGRGTPTVPDRDEVATSVALPKRQAVQARAGVEPVRPGSSHDPVFPRRKGGLTDTSANPRRTPDDADTLAALLTPSLPDMTPALQDPVAPAETEFEFEMRVRAALERIMAEGMLRHGYTATEGL